MIKVTTEIVKAMNPCQDRFKNFTDNYPNYEGSLTEFLNLDKITYSDKIWVGTRLMDLNQKVHFSVAVAESVLHIFESKYPDDKRPRELLEYIKTISDFSKITDKQRAELLQLRRAAAYVADAAAYAAYVAAADAADAAAYAAAAAADAAAADAAAYAAAAAAADAADAADAAARESQQDFNLLLVKTILESREF